MEKEKGKRAERTRTVTNLTGLYYKALIKNGDEMGFPKHPKMQGVILNNTNMTHCKYDSEIVARAYQETFNRYGPNLLEKGIKYSPEVLEGL